MFPLRSISNDDIKHQSFSDCNRSGVTTTFLPENQAPAEAKVASAGKSLIPEEKFWNFDNFQSKTLSRPSPFSSNNNKEPFSSPASPESTAFPLAASPLTPRFFKKKIKTALSMITFQSHSKTNQKLAIKIIDNPKVATNEIKYLMKIKQAQISNVACLLHCQETIQDYVDLSQKDLSTSTWTAYAVSDDSDATLSSSPYNGSGELLQKKWLLAFPCYTEFVRKRLGTELNSRNALLIHPL